MRKEDNAIDKIGKPREWTRNLWASIKLHRRVQRKSWERHELSTFLPVLYDDLWSLAGHGATVVISVPLIGKALWMPARRKLVDESARGIWCGESRQTSERSAQLRTTTVHERSACFVSANAGQWERSKRSRDQRGVSIAYHARIDSVWLHANYRTNNAFRITIPRDPVIIRNVSNPRSLYDPESSSPFDYGNW